MGQGPKALAPWREWNGSDGGPCTRGEAGIKRKALGLILMTLVSLNRKFGGCNVGLMDAPQVNQW